LIRDAIADVVDGRSLPFDRAHGTMAEIMDGHATPAQIAALLVGLRIKGETVDEIAEMAAAMRERSSAIHMEGNGRIVDLCGTGGAPLRTFNVSTIAMFVVAAAGVTVAKHGNRAVTSACGSADLLAALVAVEPLGLSVLAEPRIFGGHLDFVRRAARTAFPVLMKDIIVDPRQIDAAAASGASAVLLIQTLATRGLLRMPVQTLIDRAHDRDMDVVLEVHTLDEWDAATATDADVLGINNRDLSTMDVDLGTTRRLLSSRPKDRPAIAMSGIDRRDQIDEMLHAGADAVLVGTSVMASPNPARKLGELVHG